MSAFNKFNAFVEAVAHGKHDLATDQLALALTNEANPPVATDSVLADLTEISYANLSSRNLTVNESAQTAGLYKLAIDDISLLASGGPVAPFRYVVLFNDGAAAKDLIGFYDYGSDLPLGDGESLLVDFDDANGVINLQ